MVAIGVVFKDHQARFIGGYAENIGLGSSILAEKNWFVTFATEKAYYQGWNKMSVESNSQDVVMNLNIKRVMPWTISNRWNNCLVISQMHFICTHTYNEGNYVANSLASHAHNILHSRWWDEPPPRLIHNWYAREFSGFPNYRFVF